MYQKFFILVLCLFLLGGCLATKHKKSPDEDWQRSNTMSREKDEHHVQVRPGGLINIDDTHNGDLIEGSAAGESDDDLDNGSGNGAGVDDEDDDDGSATGPDTRTECQKLRDQLNRRMLLGAYVPECSSSGDFKPQQCSGSTGYCWCVDFLGRELDGTRKRAPSKPDCSQIETPIINKALPPTDEEERRNIIGKQHVEKDRSAQNPGYTVPTENSNTDIVTSVDPSLSNKVPGADGAKEEPTGSDGGAMFKSTQDDQEDSVAAIMGHPGILAGIIGGAVVGLLCAILLVMFIVYRMRKKDEGSYALDEPKRSPPINSYSRSTNREFYA